MRFQLVLGTRKGLFTLQRNLKNRHWSISDVHFAGCNVTAVLPVPGTERIFTAINHGHFGVKLHRSDDSGTTWQEITPPAYPFVRNNAVSVAKAPSVHEIWCLEPADIEQPDHVWAGTIPGGLFHSTDAGESWSLNESLWQLPERKEWFGGGRDEPGIHSLLVDPRSAERVHVAVSCGGIWTTEDGGESWSCRANGMFADYMPPDRRTEPHIQDPHRIARCRSVPNVLWCQHHNGIFRSDDNGIQWYSLNETASPSHFGFAVCASPTDPLTAWFVPGIKDECRIPVDGRLVVSRTRDGGRTFEELTTGLPQQHAYDIVYRHGLDIDLEGSALAMGSTTGNLWISEDCGECWQPISRSLPPIHVVRFTTQ